MEEKENPFILKLIFFGVHGGSCCVGHWIFY